ncbi:hypothetical protein BH24ACT3_BH24ACT3_11030 [soil metagenome]
MPDGDRTDPGPPRDAVRVRRLLVGAGLLVLVAAAAALYARRVDGVEVLAIILFIPVFVAFVLWHVPGGVLAALVAAVVYGMVRSEDLDVLGGGQLATLIGSRAVAYLVFGAAGGWAAHQLDLSLAKLDRIDPIDDATGLLNGRTIAEQLDLELTRAGRYGSAFSVVWLSFPRDALASISRRRRGLAVAALGPTVKARIRLVDRAGAVHGRDRLSLVLVLPETGPAGASMVADRLTDDVVTAFGEQGAADVRPTVVTRSHPTDTDVLAGMRDDLSKGGLPADRDAGTGSV